MYNGVICLLHFDDDSFSDSGPSARNTSLYGYAEFDELDGVFTPLGCLSLPVFTGPSDDGGCGLNIPLLNQELQLENDSIVVEMQVRLTTVSGVQRLVSYGGSNFQLGFSLSLNFANPSAQKVDFKWEDRFSNSRQAELQMPSNPVTAEVWHHVVFQYDKSTSYFSIWIDGTLVGSVYGPSIENFTQRPWDGIFVKDMSGVNNTSLVIGGPSGSPESFSDNLRGKVDEVRITGGYAFFNPLAESIAVPVNRYEDPEPNPEPEPLSNVSIHRAMLSGVNKTYVEEPRFTPALCSATTERPSLIPREATHEGQLYFYQPTTSSPTVFVYVLYNIQGEGEEEDLRWIPVSGVEIGKVNTTTGTNWKSRKGPLLGEPF